MLDRSCKELKISQHTLKRVDYIDRMKGFAIFLVVMGHVYFISLSNSSAAVSQVIYSFHMSLFMFLSGLVAYSGITPPYWNRVKFLHKLAKLIMPMLCFGLAFTLCHSMSPIGFLFAPAKNGYWYLMSLSVFYVSLLVFRFNRKGAWKVDVLLSMLVWATFFVLWKFTAQKKDLFCLLDCANHYPFFILGVMASKYRLLEQLRHNNWLLSIGIIGYSILMLIDFPFHVAVSLSKHIFTPLCMVVVVCSLFLSRHGKTSGIEIVSEYIGRHTLDIYVIHYFLLSSVHFSELSYRLTSTNNDLLSALIAISITLVIVAISIGIGNILHQSRWITNIVYGEWIPRRISNNNKELS